MWNFRGNLLKQKVRELITGEQKTSYGYDEAGRLAEVCSSNGIRAQYRYDRNDMQTEVLYGNGLRTSYTYDERSQLTGMDATTPLKVMETCYTYDSMERLTKEKDKVTNFVYQGGMLLHELDAAGVPNYARRNYYSKFNKYIYGLGD